MDEDAIDIRELLKEKSLTEIYRASRRIPAPLINSAIPLLVSALLSAYEAGVIKGYFPGVTPASQAAQVRGWADLGLSFGASILGFLIAGFTILVGLNRSEMFLSMAAEKDRETDLNFLKKNLFVFMQVFVEYMVFVGACLSIKIFCWPGGPATAVLSLLSSHIDLRPYAIAAAVVVGGTWLSRVLMVLKSFVFNVYHVVITSIAWDHISKEDKDHITSGGVQVAEATPVLSEGSPAASPISAPKPKAAKRRRA